jgi:broad specificity phosphatase PhoE
MTRVVLIRPGSTDYDAQNRIQGTLDIPLNLQGSEQAVQMADELRPLALNRIFSERGQSAEETAQVIGKKLGIRFRKLDKLHNVNQGLWQGLSVDEVKRKHPRVYRQWCESPATVCPPGGETIAEAYDRVVRVLKPILRRHRDQTIGLVVLEPLASLIRCYLLGQDPSQLGGAPQAERRWTIVEHGNGPPPNGSPISPNSRPLKEGE